MVSALRRSNSVGNHMLCDCRVMEAHLMVLRLWSRSSVSSASCQMPVCRTCSLQYGCSVCSSRWQLSRLGLGAGGGGLKRARHHQPQGTLGGGGGTWDGGWTFWALWWLQRCCKGTEKSPPACLRVQGIAL
jgi:hypothetical protein